MPTQLVPPERKPQTEIFERFDKICAKSSLPQILDAMPNICLIVNQEHQIVFANKAMLQFLGIHDRSLVCGKRPGEALQCIHSQESLDGCGSTEFCSTCGAVNAILKCNSNGGDVQECRIFTKTGTDAMDLRVWANPIQIEDMSYTVFTIMDISDEKRRSVLERLFFHDILNTAGALRGFCELMKKRPIEQAEKLMDRIGILARRLIEEIEGQKELLDAENRLLAIKPADVNNRDVLAEVAAIHSDQRYAEGRTIRIDPNSVTVTFNTDPALLKRILGNLLKNALEASKEGEIVTVGSSHHGKGIDFWVHNTAVMSRAVQLQVFQRSFSTKGPGRGLGSYSIKLLAERYLQGRVRFSSEPETGTTFTLSFPLALK